MACRALLEHKDRLGQPVLQEPPARLAGWEYLVLQELLAQEELMVTQDPSDHLDLVG